MTIAAIDPGTTESALLLYDGTSVVECCTLPNAEMLAKVRRLGETEPPGTFLAIEDVVHYSDRPAGRAVFQTMRWAGRFEEAWCHARDGAVVVWYSKPQTSEFVTGNPRAKDALVRARLAARWGYTLRRGEAIRTGPLAGVVGDEWQALALAVTWWARQVR
jgi:hypothetical protein